MAAKFCVKGGCHEVAIGAARSRDYCRADYNTEVLDKAELVRFEVTAGRVTDARTQVSHGAGSTVELDPQETNVAALVAAGLGRVVAERRPGGAVPGEPAPATLSEGERVVPAREVKAPKAKPEG